MVLREVNTPVIEVLYFGFHQNLSDGSSIVSKFRVRPLTKM